MDTPTKVCKVCGLHKPNTAEYFPLLKKKSKTSDTVWEYLAGKCRACRYERVKQIARNHPTPERYLNVRWRAICRNRPKKGIRVSEDLFKDAGVKYLMELWDKQRGLCAITGVPMTWGATEKSDMQTGKGLGRTVSIDRINNAQTYRRGNIQLVCAQVNYMRSSLSVEDFVAWCAMVVKNQSLND